MRISLEIDGARDGAALGDARRIFGAEGCVIGRSADCDWPIGQTNAAISRRHARILFQNASFLLEDCSTNGVFVNDSPRPLGTGNRARLVSGDKFKIGDYVFRVAIHEAPMAFANPPQENFARLDPAAIDDLAPWPTAPSAPRYAPAAVASAMPATDPLRLDDPLFAPASDRTSGRVTPATSGGIGDADFSALLSEFQPQPSPPAPSVAGPLPPENKAPMAVPADDLDAVLAEFGALTGAPSPPPAPAAKALDDLDQILGPQKVALPDVPALPQDLLPPLPPKAVDAFAGAQMAEVNLPLQAAFTPEAIEPPAPMLDRYEMPTRVVAHTPEPVPPAYDHVIVPVERMARQVPPMMPAPHQPTPPPQPSYVAPINASVPVEKEKPVPSALVKAPKSHDLRLHNDDDLPFWRGLGIDPSQLSLRARQESLRAFANAVKKFSEADNVRGVIRLMFDRLAPSAIEQKLRLQGNFSLFFRDARLWDTYVAEHREVCLAEEKSFTDAAMTYAYNGVRERNFAHAVGVRSALSTMLSHLSPASVEAHTAIITGGFLTSKKAKLWRRYVILYEEKAKNADTYLRDTLLTGFYSAYRNQLQISSGERL